MPDICGSSVNIKICVVLIMPNSGDLILFPMLTINSSFNSVAPLLSASNYLNYLLHGFQTQRFTFTFHVHVTYMSIMYFMYYLLILIFINTYYNFFSGSFNKSNFSPNILKLYSMSEYHESASMCKCL